MLDDSTIVAIATPPGMGAIAVIRVSGVDSITLTDGVFKPVMAGKSLLKAKPYTLHYGHIVDMERVIDREKSPKG